MKKWISLLLTLCLALGLCACGQEAIEETLPEETEAEQPFNVVDVDAATGQTYYQLADFVIGRHYSSFHVWRRNNGVCVKLV